MTCDAWQVVAVPFPFTDKAAQKKRPALVLSNRRFNQDGHTLMAMITSTSLKWSTDYLMQDWEIAGLTTACVVRLKLFTLDNRVILRGLGQLSEIDREQVCWIVKSMLPSTD